MKQFNNETIVIYCDGGSRGNPGPAAVGVIIADSRGFDAGPRGKKEYSKFINIATNNDAEYQAIIFAMKKVKQLYGNERAEKMSLEIKMDSELIANQLNGKFKIKEKSLVPFFIDIWNLKQDFKEVKFIQIPREENKEADKLVNQELNRQKGLF